VSETTPGTRFGAARVIVTVLLGLVAAWFLFDGVSSLIGLPELLTELGGEASEIPWVPLWLGAIQPAVIFVVAALVARRQPLARYTLVLIVALAVTATARLSLIAVATDSLFVLTF
jgi:hypothetical protein